MSSKRIQKGNVESIELAGLVLASMCATPCINTNIREPTSSRQHSLLCMRQLTETISFVLEGDR